MGFIEELAGCRRTRLARSVVKYVDPFKPAVPRAKGEPIVLAIVLERHIGDDGAAGK
jgi:hypothetical protein